MNSRQVEAFRAVIKLGSMTHAADLMGVSQPAISRLIRDFETSLNLRLFRREGNKLVPTYEASILFEEVDLHYRGMAQIEKVARDLAGQSGGSLRIAAPSSLATFFLPELTKNFLERWPAVAISIVSASSHLITERVALRQIEVGLVQVSGDRPGVRTLKLSAKPAVCILHADNPLCAHEVITPELIRNENFISLGPNSPLRARIDATFADTGVTRASMIEVDLAATVRALVSRGVGVSIVDPFAAANIGYQDVVTRPFEPNVPYDLAAVLPAHRSLSSHTQNFLELIRTHIQSQ